MKDIIFRYLINNYEINLTTYSKLRVFDKHEKIEVTQDWLRTEITCLYGLEDDDELEVFEIWLRGEIIKVENELTDMQFQIYEKTGIELDMNTTAWVSDLHSEALNRVDLSDEGNVKVGLSDYTQKLLDKLDRSRRIMKKLDE
jgi:hypothetical protein